MGNRQRGVVPVEEEAMVVQRDAWARRYGCGFDVQNHSCQDGLTLSEKCARDDLKRCPFGV